MTVRHQRLRGRKGVKLREAVKKDEPLCRTCLANDPPRLRLAVEVDHIVPLSRGGTNDPSNLQPLCKACHAEKTTGRGPRGNDIKGRPLAPDHPWNQKR